MTMQFPVFFSLEGRTVLVVGGGESAARKLRLIRKSGAQITVVAPSVTEEIAKLSASGDLIWTRRCFKERDVKGAALAYGASDVEGVDTAVSILARRHGVPVNVVDRPDISDFITPAIVDRSPIVIGISSGGTAPVLIRRIRESLERSLPPGLGRLAEFADKFRSAVKAMVPPGRARLRFWENFFDGPIAEQVLAGDEQGATDKMLAEVNRDLSEEVMAGVVHIVGAGPGAADLMTIRAERLLQKADVIVYDKLVSPDILEMARRDADRIYVGKTRANHSVPQDGINDILVREAQAGKRVVRLKGGDPFIFGRGGEELERLQEAGITAHVVPGVTAAAACGAAVGMPLTHRDYASSVTFVTGHGVNGEPDVDWASLVSRRQTLVIYMGLHTSPILAQRLMDQGMAPATPVTIVENGSRENQRTVMGTVGTLATMVEAHGLKGPAIVTIGAVAALADAGHETERTSALAVNL